TKDLGQVWFLDLNTFQWEKQSEEYSPRTLHSAVVYKDSMWVFGGNFDAKIVKDAFCEYQIRQKKWKKVKSFGTTPLLRHSHSASVWRNYMIVFGGNHDFKFVDSDIWLFEFDSQHWKKLVLFPKIDILLYCHCVTVIGDELYVIGGELPGNKYFENTLCVNLRTHEWKVKTQLGIIKGILPACVSCGDCIYLHGGCSLYYYQ